MILEYRLDYRSSSLVYEKIFLQALKEFSLVGKVIREGFLLKLYVEAKSVAELESFVDYFSASLPHSIFLYNTEVNIVEAMPETEGLSIDKQEKLPLPFCLKCLKRVLDTKSSDYYNVFRECEVCGYGVCKEKEEKNYKALFEEMALSIVEGEVVELNTFYGKYYVGFSEEVYKKRDFDIVAYDLATVKRYANVEEFEINALGSFEKPFIKLKTKIDFSGDFEAIERDLIRFKLPDDFVLFLLMEEMHKRGKDILFITKEKIEAEKQFSFVTYKEEMEPIEVVASASHVAIVRGEKGLPSFPVLSRNIAPIVGATYSVIKEHSLEDREVVGVYLSKQYQNGIVLYREKYGMVNYLSLEAQFDSIADIFKQIRETDETAARLVENYKKKFPEHFEKISNFLFEKKSFNIYEVWGIVALILDFSPSLDLQKASVAIEENSCSFLGKKGPRIDYKVVKKGEKASLDYLMIIRSAMSFRLAGVDVLSLSYGIVESFAEFLVNEIEDIKESMQIESVVIAGSLLENKRLFFKLSKDGSINSNIYFNNQLPVDERNIVYGDYLLKKS